jgi:uracil-DNA glycosylase family 4
MDDFELLEAEKALSVKTNDGELSLSNLKRVNLATSPLFSLVEDTELSIDNLREKDSCLCPRFKALNPPILPKGSIDSKVVFVADQPDENSAEAGYMFSDKSQPGYMFEHMLGMLRLRRENVYVTSVVFCRGVEKDANPKSLYSCARLHKKEFDLMTRVKYIFTLGNFPFYLVTGVGGNHGPYIGSYIPITLNGNEVNVIPLYNVNYMLGSDLAQQKVFDTLKLLSQK